MLRLLATLIILSLTLPAAVQIERVAYKGWSNCYRISNGKVELIVTADVGPRVIRYGFVGKQNLFKEFEDQLGRSGEKEWVARGGHRLWVAPEDRTYTYAPDNVPVEVEIRQDRLIATAPVEPSTRLQKQMVIHLASQGTGVRVIHRIKNRNPFTIEIAPWALTMMAPGGIGITGFPPRGSHPEHLLPTNPLVMWAYTDLSDPRWHFTKKYLILRQDRNTRTPQKIGHFNEKTWGAYLLGSQLFIKRATANPRATYPDFGCSFETFTNNEFLELETLGPLTKLAPNGVVEHVEVWSLHEGIELKELTDEELDRVLMPLLE